MLYGRSGIAAAGGTDRVDHDSAADDRGPAATDRGTPGGDRTTAAWGQATGRAILQREASGESQTTRPQTRTGAFYASHCAAWGSNRNDHRVGPGMLSTWWRRPGAGERRSSDEGGSSDPSAPGDHRLPGIGAVSYTHLRAHETRHDLVC